MGGAEVGQGVVGLLRESGFQVPPKTLEGGRPFRGDAAFALTSSERVVRAPPTAAWVIRQAKGLDVTFPPTDMPWNTR